MCEFCERFDFRSASYEIDKYGVRIVLAGGSYRFPEHLQFKLCPICGEARTHITHTTAQETVNHTIDMSSYTLALETLNELAEVGKLNKELSVFLHNLFENARHEMAEANDKALTVEELREMDGEPVWVVYPEAESPNEWGILKGQTCIIATGYFLEFMSYGVQWLAYRRPPEKGE